MGGRGGGVLHAIITNLKKTLLASSVKNQILNSKDIVHRKRMGVKESER